MVKGPITSGYKNHCVCQWRHVSSVLEVRHFFFCEYVLGNHMILYVIGTLYDLHDLHQILIDTMILVSTGNGSFNHFKCTSACCKKYTVIFSFIIWCLFIICAYSSPSLKPLFVKDESLCLPVKTRVLSLGGETFFFLWICPWKSHDYICNRNTIWFTWFTSKSTW
jgi:hypothetical protein